MKSETSKKTNGLNSFFESVRNIPSHVKLIAVGLVLTLVGCLAMATMILSTPQADAASLLDRQALFSQRIAKTLFAISDARANQYRTDAFTDELKLAVDVFENTQNVLIKGGKIEKYDGKTITISKLSSERALAKIESIQPQWITLRDKIAPLIIGGNGFTNDQLTKAVNVARVDTGIIFTALNEAAMAQREENERRTAWQRLIFTIAVILMAPCGAWVLWTGFLAWRAILLEAEIVRNRPWGQVFKDSVFATSVLGEGESPETVIKLFSEENRKKIIGQRNLGAGNADKRDEDALRSEQVSTRPAETDYSDPNAGHKNQLPPANKRNIERERRFQEPFQSPSPYLPAAMAKENAMPPKRNSGDDAQDEVLRSPKVGVHDYGVREHLPRDSAETRKKRIIPGYLIPDSPA
ncbi:MAG: hypothetical protein LBG61_01835 [Burkholderiales bacterium]|jgi:hypothetical protein|nr:hypothetical protein [Burkholderiales bacterium]